MSLINNLSVIQEKDDRKVLKECEDQKPLTDAILISEAEKPLKKKENTINEQGNQIKMIIE